MNRIINDVDLIITTRNRIEDLTVTLNQLVNYKFPLAQVYIVDDASTDDTSSYLKTYFPQINLTTNKSQKGLIANRNTLIKTTKRPYILSLDDDSCFMTLDDLIEAIHLLNSKVNYGIFHFTVFEQLSLPPSKDKLSSKISEVRIFIGCGHIIKREMLKSTGLYLELLEFYCEEIDLSFKAFKKGFKIINKENLVVHHRIDRELRKIQKESNVDEGIYGYYWRAKMQLANNLLMVYLHYPNIIKPIYYTTNLIMMLKITKSMKTLVDAVKLFRIRKKKVVSKRNPLTISQFRTWKKLPGY